MRSRVLRRTIFQRNDIYVLQKVELRIVIFSPFCSQGKVTGNRCVEIVFLFTIVPAKEFIAFTGKISGFCDRATMLHRQSIRFVLIAIIESHGMRRTNCYLKGDSLSLYLAINYIEVKMNCIRFPCGIFLRSKLHSNNCSLFCPRCIENAITILYADNLCSHNITIVIRYCNGLFRRLTKDFTEPVFDIVLINRKSAKHYIYFLRFPGQVFSQVEFLRVGNMNFEGHRTVMPF